MFRVLSKFLGNTFKPLFQFFLGWVLRVSEEEHCQMLVGENVIGFGLIVNEYISH